MAQAATTLSLPESGSELARYYDALGPIRDLVMDDSLTEVMVNGPDRVYVERDGKILLTDRHFDSAGDLLEVINFVANAVGRRIDARTPMVDARLWDGSRVHAIIAPVSLDGPSLTIRKFSRTPYTAQDLIDFGSITPEAFGYLDACVKAKMNILISGGTDTGKTTLLNVLSGFIPGDERIISIEDSAELQLHQENVRRLEARPPDIYGEGEVTIRELVRNSLRMRPDRIIVGECRGGEALDMLQAMNTGHEGSMTTLHSNTARDGLARLETLVMQAGMHLPVHVIRQQVAAAINVLVHLTRLVDGSRKVASISEILGMEGETVTIQDIFTYEAMAADAEGHLRGTLRPTGVRPRVLERLAEQGLVVPPELEAIYPGAGFHPLARADMHL